MQKYLFQNIVISGINLMLYRYSVYI